MNRSNVLILMTALPPTCGHSDLIDFASRIHNAHVHVMLNGRSFEPLSMDLRTGALQEHFTSYKNITIKGDLDNTMPQNPEEHPDFWNIWLNKINTVFPNTTWDYVVASEDYGKKLAEICDARFLPFDINRELNPAKATTARLDLLSKWDDILEPVRRDLMVTGTLFGQESVGKTTIAREMNRSTFFHSIFEYARPLLETTSSEITNESMLDIVLGQTALQEQAKDRAVRPLIIQDTDLFSTIGYYELVDMEMPKPLYQAAHRLKSDVYYLLPPDIPFEKDPLRYGGDERETDIDYWINILNREGLPYVLVEGSSLDEKILFIKDDMFTRFQKKNMELVQFVRD